jgi:aspartyl-tRNA(Asn)/glutamyl-tRNA(Gln) amidotransferase subunit C
MTVVTSDAVRQLAALSAIALTDEEVEDLRVDIAIILTYVAQLSELDTDNVPPTYQVTDLENVWREDTIQHELTTEIVQLAPEAIHDQFKVPKVL